MQHLLQLLNFYSTRYVINNLDSFDDGMGLEDELNHYTAEVHGIKSV